MIGSIRSRLAFSATFIDEMTCGKLDAYYGVRGMGEDGATAGAIGHRHGSRTRT
jgi:hypothetical protein